MELVSTVFFPVSVHSYGLRFRKARLRQGSISTPSLASGRVDMAEKPMLAGLSGC